ncbi:endo-beta-N-acetylglucosaminidase [Bifidobacterium samirii]|uniref:Glycosyl hydrolase family 85 n=1 Tax=Bifidobacterium samirii TaxID=2306974 RepID=A0A430FV29_9BIFI|nr:Ig-like domain-containing protein [Bifidobacterium samirii]RSX57243.1 glycosyl hydrolase family 85 [Bifidobacterium samirii]
MTLSSDTRAARHRGTRRWLRAGLAAVLSMATLGALVAPANATDTMPWGGQYADTGHPEQAAGDHQPYQHGYTGLDILNWDPAADKDSQYLRSRVPLQARIAANATTQKDPDLPADTEMFNLAGDYGNAFFESFHDNNVFSQYLFNYWQYTDYYGTWHGQPTSNTPKGLYDDKAQSDWTQKWFEFGTLNLPNAAYTNAAHKNGAKSIATIFYSNNDRGEQTYGDLLRGKRDDGTYPIADKLVEIAEYYGFDGYFINQESDVAADDVAAYQDFMKQIADQGIYVQWYDSASYQNGAVDYQNMFNAVNSPWVQDGAKGKVSDSIFLNYWYNGDMLKDSAAHAANLGLDAKTSVFAGIEAGQQKFDGISKNADYMNVNLDADGKPYVSLAALGTDFVSHELGDQKKIYPQYQNEVFDRERRLWTGSSTGEQGTSDIADDYIDDGTGDDGWKGFASQIAERSVVGGPVFSTSFNTGHGLEWRDAGKQTSDQQWGNINLQDILPTWQWWIEADSDPLGADFDYGEDYVAAPRFTYTKVGAYEGGDSLVLSGRLSSDNTMRLYKTDLDVKDGTKVDLTYNKLKSDDSELQLALIFADDTKAVVPVSVADGSATDGWKTVTADLSEYAGKKIATLGLIVKAGADPIDDYQINIGKLTVSDGAAYTPAVPTGFKVERAYADSDELTVKWDLADYSTTKNYLLYLDDTFLGGRYDDTLYVKHLPAKTGTLRLYAVGADGSRSLAAEAQLDEAAAVSDVKVEPGKDGSIKVSWTNPQVSGEKTVTVKSDTGSWRYASTPFSTTVKVAADRTEVTIADAPVDGSRYVLTIDNAGGAVATKAGAFADATIEPYPTCSVTWNGDDVTLVRPDTQDWRYLYMTERWTDENGERQSKELGATYTYSQNTPPITGIIRGRTTPGSYVRNIPAGHELWVQVEDYDGNRTEPMRIPTSDELADCTADTSTLPDAAKSELAVIDGEAVADGKATRSIAATIKDSFGNPMPGAEVSFTLSDGLVAVDGATTITTDSTGVATLNVVSSTAGDYAVTATLDGAPIGAGVTVAFTAVPSTVDKTRLQAEVDKAKALNASDYTADTWKKVTEALESAEAALSDGNATQEQVDAARDGLVAAVASLKRASEDGDASKPSDGKPDGGDRSDGASDGSDKDAKRPLSSTGASVTTVLAGGLVLLCAGAALVIRRRMQA